MNTKKYVQSSDLLIFFFQLLTTGFRTNKLEMTVFEKGFSLEVSNTVRKTFNIIKSMKLIFWFKRSTEKQVLSYGRGNARMIIMIMIIVKMINCKTEN